MNRRALLSGLLVVLCFVALWVIFGQRQQLADLRAEQQRLLAQLSPEASQPAPMAADSTAPDKLEVLRLRSEITRLLERKRALAGVTNENERLRVQVANNRTNSPGGLELPPGYLRKSQARMVGYGTPEDTLQSFLWAVQNRDITNLLQALAPEPAQQFQAKVQQSGASAAQVWQESEALIGFRVLDRKQQPDGSMVLNVAIVPDMPPAQIRFRLTGGQWRLEGF